MNIHKVEPGFRDEKLRAAYVNAVTLPVTGHVMAEFRAERTLSVCLIQIVGGHDKYVVWYFNHEDGGFFQGSYLDDEIKAWREFIHRMSRSTGECFCHDKDC